MEAFRLNSKIELITENDDKTFGTIYDVIDDKLHVSITSDDKEIKLLYVGDSVNCVVFQNNGGTSFDAVVSKRIPGDTPLYELSDIKNLEEIKRRQDVRIPCTMEILYSDNKMLLSLEKSKLDELEINKIEHLFNIGTLGDISGGGIRFVSHRKVVAKELIFYLKLEDDTLFVKGLVINEYVKLKSKDSFYSYGVKFIHLSEKEKDRIIKFIFVLMRRNRLR